LEYVKDLHNKYRINWINYLMNIESTDTVDVGEIKINISECNCCLTTDDLIKCPLENCEYTICKKCLKKIPGCLCPACRREIKKPKIKRRRRRIEVTYFLCWPVSRSTGEKILTFRYLLFFINLILTARLVWFFIFNDKPFFHDTWFLSAIGGIFVLILTIFLLVTIITIIGMFINCMGECLYCCLYGEEYDNIEIINPNCVCLFIEEDCCCCFMNCIREEIHYVTDENDTYIVSLSDSDYSSGEDSLELD